MIQKIKHTIRQFFRGDGKSDVKVQTKTDEAEKIKRSMHRDVIRVQKKVEKFNRMSQTTLDEISIDLESITYKIAVATGGRKRGLK